MTFCIRESEYDPEIHNIVSGPHVNCNNCPPLSSAAEFFGFMEIEIPKVGLAGSQSDLVAIMLNNSQFITNYEILSKPSPDQSDCSYFSSEENCPEGFVYSGDASDCEADCDKICCRPPNPDHDVFICGRAINEGASYNDPWHFHIVPETVSFKYRDQTSGMKIVSSIDDIENDSDVCFSFKDRSRIMKMLGSERCGHPLELSFSRIFDEDEGEHVQVGICDGPCEDREGDNCYDYSNAKLKEKLDKVRQDAIQKILGMDEEEFADYMFDNITTIEMITSDRDDSEIFELFISSSSSEPDQEILTSYYSEPAASSDPASPSEVVLHEGVNNILIDVVSENFIIFNVGEGSNISSIYSLGWTSDFPEDIQWFGEMFLQRGSSWDQDGDLVGTSEFGPSLSSILFPEIVPLSEGSYVMKIASQHQGPEISFLISMILERDVE